MDANQMCCGEKNKIISFKNLKEEILQIESYNLSYHKAGTTVHCKPHPVPQGRFSSPLFPEASSVPRNKYDEVLPNVYLGGWLVIFLCFRIIYLLLCKICTYIAQTIK